MRLRSSAFDWKAAGIVAAITLAAGVFRLPSLLHNGLSRDEANVYVELLAPTFGAFLHRVADIDYHPPLYFLLEYFWAKTAGVGEIAFKSLPFACSLLTVPAVYALGKAANSKILGFLAAALFAIAPFPINYSTTYLYPLAILANAWFALQVTSSRRNQLTPGSYALTACSSLAAVYTHYTALILVPFVVLWTLLSPNGIKHGVRAASAIVLGALPFAFWLPVFLHQHQVGLPYESPAQLTQSIQFVVVALALLLPVPPWLPVVTVFVAVILVLFVFNDKAWRSDSTALGAIALCTIVVIAGAGLTITRYVLPFSTLFYIFLAWIFVSFAQKLAQEDVVAWRKFGIPAAAFLTVALVAVNATYVPAAASIPRSGIRTFVASVPIQSDTLYLIAPDNDAPGFAYYARDTNAQFIGFARLRHPEYYVLDGYAGLWNDPSLLPKTMGAIAGESRQFRYLEVVADRTAQDQYHVRFGRVWELVAELKRRYPFVSRTDYDGSWEPISVYRFLLTPQTNDQRK